MDSGIKKILLFAAIGCFALGAFNFRCKINLIGLGLFFWTVGRYTDVN